MADSDARLEQRDPEERYGIPPVRKSRTEALEEIQNELRREMARRAGAYGRRLSELTEALEEARGAFEAGLEVMFETALVCFGPQAARWSWPELVARIEAPPSGDGATVAEGIRAVERSAERHEGLRAEALTVHHHLIIHREAMGFRRHHLVEEKFPLPGPLPSVEVAWQRARNP